MQQQERVSLEEMLWDVIVIGTGMGGGTLGNHIAKKGHRVLFIEKGLDMAEAKNIQPTDEDTARLRLGGWPSRVKTTINNNTSETYMTLGCGTGGTSLLYAAALERFSRVDFEPSSPEEMKSRGSSYDGWPLDYDQFLPYYKQAEKLFRVRGTADPLDPDDSTDLLTPPVLSEQEAHFMESFEDLGLHPYRIHVGIEYVDNCTECLGHACEFECKSDSNRLCVQPVLANENVGLLTRAEVTRIEAGPNHVNHVECALYGQVLKLKAKVYVLAAGAYFTPVVLLKSANAHWPNGLLNDTDLVGRNLMFHISDFAALWPLKDCSKDGANKAISLRDFYNVDGERRGSFQSTGLQPSRDHIFHFLTQMFEDSRIRIVRRMPSKMIRWIAVVASKIYARSSIFATILEDYPYPENRIVVDSTSESSMQVVYKMSRELRSRNRRFRKHLRSKLKTHRLRFLKRQASLNMGHPCGTCRFGTDPEHSVLNPDNQAHQVDNIYVVDASFFPSSGGANPSLTIAANAIRVADIIDSRLAEIT